MAKEEKVRWTGMPSSEAELKEIKAAIEATYDPYLQMAEAKANIKDIFDDLNARTGIPKKIFNFLAKANFKGDGFEQVQVNTEINEAFETLQKVTF